MFSEEWESIYSKGLQNSIWPWSDLVSRVMRTAKDERLNLESVNVLELGCGAGANVAFFGALESRYHGIDGSASTIVGLQNRFKENKKIKFSKMDFTKELPDECFNLFIDRSSVTHNTTDAIRNTLALCGKKAEKGAIFLGFDWFSTLHSDYAFGKTLGDKYITEAKYIELKNNNFLERNPIYDVYICVYEGMITHEKVQDNTREQYWYKCYEYFRKYTDRFSIFDLINKTNEKGKI